jgi:hypothetical protein
VDHDHVIEVIDLNVPATSATSAPVDPYASVRTSLNNAHPRAALRANGTSIRNDAR